MIESNENLTQYNYYIYKTTNLINQKQYIGKHKGNIQDNYLGSGILITAAIDKYGAKNFKKEILCLCKTEEEANEKEKYYIQLFNAINDTNFYNVADGGQGGYVTKGYTTEQRLAVNKKISEANSGQKHHMYNKHHSEETKKKLREKSLAYWTEEKRKERSIAYSGENNPAFGIKHSEEAIEKTVKSKRKKVYQLDKNTGELIQEYKSINEAQRALNVSHGLISRVLDKSGRTAYGFKWVTNLKSVETIESSRESKQSTFTIDT